MRVLDTRIGLGGPSLRAGERRQISHLGAAAGVPASGVTAVVINLSADNALASGFVAVYAGGGAWPGNSTLNFAPGQATPNLVFAPIGSDGLIGVTASQDIDLFADVFGYITDASNATPDEGHFRPVNPVRLMDTRYGRGGWSGRVQPGVPGTPLTVAGVTVDGTSIPANAWAVVLNVTATDPVALGFLAVYPKGQDWQGTSNVNFGTGQTIPNRVVVPVGLDGQVYIASSTATNVIVDVNGWLTDVTNQDPPGVYGAFTAVSKARLLDTRYGTGGYSAPLAPGGMAQITIPGALGIVPTNATAVVLNVTAINATETSFIAVFPDQATWNVTSDLNTGPGGSSVNLVVVRVGPNGKVNLTNERGTVDLIADLVGWYT